MPNFHYEAWNAKRQPISGELEAENVQDAITQLESRGLTIESIGSAPSEPQSRTIDHRSTDANAARRVIEQKVLHTHLAKVLDGGQAIIPAIRAFSEEVPAGQRRNELQKLVHILERGDAEEAERAFSDLPEYWIPLLSAAISSSDPGRILHEFIRESQRSDELRRQWRMTLAYPIFVAFIAGAVLVFLSVLVIPTFRSIFLEFGLELPTITLLNLTLAYWIAKAGPFVLLAFALAAGAAVFFWMRGKAQPFGLSNGFFGLFGRTTAIARLSQFMADLLEAGLSVPDTLKVAGFLTNRKTLRTSVWRLADQLQSDASAAMHIEAPRRMWTIFQAMRAEMPTQSRIQLLREITQAYTERARLRLSWTRGVIEPATIVVIGLVVGCVVVSLFWPLMNLLNALSK